jgi:hypothetical protein
MFTQYSGLQELQAGAEVAYGVVPVAPQDQGAVHTGLVREPSQQDVEILEILDVARRRAAIA